MDRDGSLSSGRTAVPGVGLIETAWRRRDGRKEPVRAGPPPAYRSRPTRPANSRRDGSGCGRIRQERPRSNPQQETAILKRRLPHRTPHDNAHTRNTRCRGWGSLPQTPWDLSLSGQSRRRPTETGRLRVPSPVLAPGTALGSRPRVALSSAQAIRHSIHGTRRELVRRARPPSPRSGKKYMSRR